MLQKKENSSLSFQSLVECIVSRYNDNNTLQLSIVGSVESPWCADTSITKVDRMVFVAPKKNTFRSEELNDIIYQIEMMLGQQVLDCGYFFYFHSRLALASLNIGREDGRFQYKYKNLIKLLPESVESCNRLLFFPCTTLAEYYYRGNSSADFQMVNADFSLLSEFGFDPHVHLNEEEMNWQEKKESKPGKNL